MLLFILNIIVVFQAKLKLKVWDLEVYYEANADYHWEVSHWAEDEDYHIGMFIQYNIALRKLQDKL